MAARMAGEELIRALEGAGGTLRVPNPSGSVRHACRSAIHDALERHLVPAGHRLRHTGRDKGDLVIRLVSEADAMPGERSPRLAGFPR